MFTINFTKSLLVLGGVILAGSAVAANADTSTLRVHIDSPVHNYVTTQPRITLSGTYADDAYPNGVIPANQDANHSITVFKNAKGFADPAVGGTEATNSRAYGPMDEPCCAVPTKTGSGKWTVEIPLSHGMNVIMATHRVTGSPETAAHSIRINYVAPQTPDLPVQVGSESSSNGSGGSDQQSPPTTPKKKPGAVLGSKSRMNVPATVDRIFRTVFGVKITPKESTYWKHRLRTDKPTETSLQNTMLFYKAKHVTMPR